MGKFKRNDKRLGAIVDMPEYSYASLGCGGYFVEVETPAEEILNNLPIREMSIQEILDALPVENLEREFTPEEIEEKRWDCSCGSEYEYTHADGSKTRRCMCMELGEGKWTPKK